jgi:hypothetical protein
MNGNKLTGPSSVFKHVTAWRVLEREIRGAAHCRGARAPQLLPLDVAGPLGVRCSSAAIRGAGSSSLLLLLPARSADRKKSLQFGRRGGVEPGLLKEPSLSILLLGFAGRLEGCSLGSFRGRSLCGFSRYRLAFNLLSLRDPDVAGCDDLRSSLYSPHPGGVVRDCPSAFNLSLLRSAGSS